MNFIIENWYIIIAALAIGFALGFAVYRFVKLPMSGQLAKLREWLLYAVTMAETELGGGTGQLKLRMVYDLFVERFAWLARVISFETFSGLVDDALVEMREMLAKNSKVQAIVGGDNHGN